MHGLRRSVLPYRLPAGEHHPDWNDLVFRDRWREAWPGCTPRTIFRSSPAASARPPARPPARSRSGRATRSRSSSSRTRSSTAPCTRASCPGRPRARRVAASPWSGSGPRLCPPTEVAGQHRLVVACAVELVEVAVDHARALAALVDRPDDQRLAAAGVAGGEHARRPTSRTSPRLDVAARVACRRRAARATPRARGAGSPSPAGRGRPAARLGALDGRRTAARRSASASDRARRARLVPEARRRRSAKSCSPPRPLLHRVGAAQLHAASAATA